MIHRLASLLAHVAERVLAYPGDPWRVPASQARANATRPGATDSTRLNTP